MKEEFKSVAFNGLFNVNDGIIALPCGSEWYAFCVEYGVILKVVDNSIQRFVVEAVEAIARVLAHLSLTHDESQKKTREAAADRSLGCSC